MSDKYEKWRERIEKHDLSHTTGCQAQVDSSCVVCYRPSEIMKKEFRRFWKWYREEVPEVTSYSRKTEESFEELMDENFHAVERTGTEKARMKKRLVLLITSMRYERSPNKTLSELGELICQMVVVSEKFTKKRKEARNLYEEYLSSESEGYSTDGSNRKQDDSERTRWYEETLTKVIMKHNLDCELGIESKTRDGSCQRCFPIPEGISKNGDFLEFWEWYRKTMDAELFTGETVRIFNRLKAVQFRNRTDINEENFAELTLLVLSMRYNKKPKYDIWEISLEILEIMSVSREFGIGIKEAIERIGKEKEISEESTKIISDENGSSDETKKGESSKPKEEIYEKEEDGVITIYVNRKGIFNIAGTGKEFRIEIDENNNEERLSGNEVVELCGSTVEDMNSVFGEIDELIRKLNGEQGKTTLLEELEDDIRNTHDEKGKTDKGKEKEILEDDFDEFENIINKGGFDPSKTLEFEKESEKEFEKESQESESEPEEEPLVINPVVDMAMNIIRVNEFNGENIDPEEWLQEFERTTIANNWGDNVKVGLAAAHLKGAAAQWY